MAIRLQGRDKQLLSLLADDFLLLTREQIQQLIPRGIRRTNQRLALLTKHGLLTRRVPADRLSPNTIFYFIGEKAADEMNLDDPLSIRERRTRAKNFGDSYLRHLHLINAVHMKFLTNKEKDYQFHHWTPYDNTNWEGLHSLKLRPDGFVTFEKRGRQFGYFVEIDRGTERGASIRKKIEQYHSFDFSGTFWEEFKRDWFRVLFVTTETSRCATLLKIFPSKIFWTATAEEVLAHPLFEPCWASKEGSRLALNLDPDAEQTERAAKHQAGLPATSPPVAAKAQAYTPPRSPTKGPILTVVTQKKLPKKKITPGIWFKFAEAIGIACVAFLFILVIYQIFSNVSAAMPPTSGVQVFDVPDSIPDPMWKIVMVAGALIVLRFFIDAFI